MVGIIARVAQSTQWTKSISSYKTLESRNGFLSTVSPYCNLFQQSQTVGPSVYFGWCWLNLWWPSATTPSPIPANPQDIICPCCPGGAQRIGHWERRKRKIHGGVPRENGIIPYSQAYSRMMSGYNNPHNGTTELTWIFDWIISLAKVCFWNFVPGFLQGFSDTHCHWLWDHGESSACHRKVWTM